jgi:hypothetical protein
MVAADICYSVAPPLTLPKNISESVSCSVCVPAKNSTQYSFVYKINGQLYSVQFLLVCTGVVRGEPVAHGLIIL